MKKDPNKGRKLSLDKLQMVRITNAKTIRGGNNGNGGNDTVVDKTIKDTVVMTTMN